MRQMARCVGLPASRIVVLRNVVDDVPLLPPCPADCDGLLFAGRLSREKGPELMLELARRLDWVRVVIAGDGPCASELREQVRGENLSNVVLTGQLDQAQLRHHLQRSAALVLPSRAMENSPQIMLEAMLAGRCVIVPDQPPLREWVQDRHTGRLFAQEDVESLAAVAQEVLSDVAGREAMCRRARQLVLRRHDPAVLTGQLEAHYHRAEALCASR
jgi:glycosyltransferase involved in cell wall biosynthesis